MNKIKDIKNDIWKYDQEQYNKLSNEDVKYSEMAEIERKFVNGLIRCTKPKNILEVGVAEGGGSIVILNAIEDMPSSKLISIDLLENLYYDNSKKTGFSCIEKHSDNNQWKLYTGNDPSELIEDLAVDGKFDFVIIDTAHVHPIESLNFLSVFPYLTDDCVVVLHDIGLYATHSRVELYKNFPNCSFATKLLFDTIVGEKYILPVSAYEENLESSNIVFSNIGACQLNSDSKKYIYNTISMLNFPWGFYPYNINIILQFIKKHYDADIHEQCVLSSNINQKLVFNKNKSYKDPIGISFKDFDDKKIVFYGCGKYFMNIFKFGKFIFKDFILNNIDIEVWDNQADKVDMHLFETPKCIIRKPDFNNNNKDNIIIFITIDPNNEEVIKEIKEELLLEGFKHIKLFDELNN